MNILIINGPNLNLLGKREPKIYGTKTYKDLVRYCHSLSFLYGITVKVRQSNHEGVLIDWLHKADSRYQGVVLNAGALTHYSYALYDAIKAITIPVVEVHLSDIKNREPFRHQSVISNACIETITGLGFQSYEEGIKLLLEKSDNNDYQSR